MAKILVSPECYGNGDILRPRARVNVYAGDEEIRLTVREARSLARDLVQAADAADAAERRREDLEDWIRAGRKGF